jgi:hypothetical protein
VKVLSVKFVPQQPWPPEGGDYFLGYLKKEYIYHFQFIFLVLIFLVVVIFVFGMCE